LLHVHLHAASARGFPLVALYGIQAPLQRAESLLLGR
jgi:hypothetical protein